MHVIDSLIASNLIPPRCLQCGNASEPIITWIVVRPDYCLSASSWSRWRQFCSQPAVSCWCWGITTGSYIPWQWTTLAVHFHCLRGIFRQVKCISLWNSLILYSSKEKHRIDQRDLSDCYFLYRFEFTSGHQWRTRTLALAAHNLDFIWYFSNGNVERYPLNVTGATTQTFPFQQHS